MAEQNEQNAMNSLAGWMDSVSGDKNTDETEPTYTNVFAQLYDNGDGTETLIFTSDENYREEGKELKDSWDITDKHFIYGDSPETSIMPPWLDASAGYMNSTIKEVKLVNEIKPKYTSLMFSCLTALENIEGMEKLNTENTLDMTYMFMGCISLTNLDLSHFDTSKVTNMSLMFSGCESLTSLNLSSFDTSNVTNMSYMFNQCSNLSTIYVSPNWTTAANADWMFSGCIAQEVTPKP